MITIYQPAKVMIWFLCFLIQNYNVFIETLHEGKEGYQLSVSTVYTWCFSFNALRVSQTAITAAQYCSYLRDD